MTTKSPAQALRCVGAGIARVGGSQWWYNIAAEALYIFFFVFQKVSYLNSIGND